MSPVWYRDLVDRLIDWTIPGCPHNFDEVTDRVAKDLDCTREHAGDLVWDLSDLGYIVLDRHNIPERKTAAAE